ncbi:hypothetical protein pb186bvf_000790 [Paramecium bursaria]
MMNFHNFYYHQKIVIILLLFIRLTLEQTIVYQENFNSTNLQLFYTLDVEQKYSIQITFIQLPEPSTYLPAMIVTSQSTNYSDDANIQLRNGNQQVYIKNTGPIIIRVQNIKISGPTVSDIDMYYRITIIANSSQPQLCLFPNYGYNCQYKIIELTPQVQYKLIVANSKWYIGYLKLQQSNYNLIITSQNSTIGLSILPLDQPQYTLLPNFNQKYQTIEKLQQQTVLLTQQSFANDYVVAFGIYNFENDESSIINFQVNEQQAESTFPTWLYGLISVIIALGLIISLIIYIQMQRQATKIQQEKPALDREILDKYCPAIRNGSLNQEENCTVCLISFVKKELIRVTPCKHVFHDSCLSEWTQKQSNCPNCRYCLNETDLIIKDQLSSEQSQGNYRINHERNALSNTFNPLPSFRNVNRLIISNNNRRENEYSPTQIRSAQRLHSINDINRDDIIEQ